MSSNHKNWNKPPHGLMGHIEKPTCKGTNLSMTFKKKHLLKDNEQTNTSGKAPRLVSGRNSPRRQIQRNRLEGPRPHLRSFGFKGPIWVVSKENGWLFPQGFWWFARKKECRERMEKKVSPRTLKFPPLPLRLVSLLALVLICSYTIPQFPWSGDVTRGLPDSDSETPRLGFRSALPSLSSAKPLWNRILRIGPVPSERFGASLFLGSVGLLEKNNAWCVYDFCIKINGHNEQLCGSYGETKRKPVKQQKQPATETFSPSLGEPQGVVSELVRSRGEMIRRVP